MDKESMSKVMAGSCPVDMTGLLPWYLWLLMFRPLLWYGALVI